MSQVGVVTYDDSRGFIVRAKHGGEILFGPTFALGRVKRWAESSDVIVEVDLFLTIDLDAKNRPDPKRDRADESL